MTILRFAPIYKQRVWGGRRLETKLGRTLPDGDPYGESWEIVDRPEAQSVVTDGDTLRAMIAANPEAIMGPGWDPDKPFPILVKWLDCDQRLSLQVHPPKDVAEELDGEPKTENWYIADCEPGSRLLVGLRRNATRESFQIALENNAAEAMVHSFEVTPGDSMFVYSGRIHAIDAGNLILEIQQNSDTTYRVYDWGRVGLDGQPRELHVEQSMKSIDWEDFQPQPIRGSLDDQELADCAEFRIRKCELTAERPYEKAASTSPAIISVVSGNCTANDGTALPYGTNALIPYADAARITPNDSKATILVTDGFAG